MSRERPAVSAKFLTNCKSISAARKSCPWATLFAKEPAGVWCFADNAAYYEWLDAGRPRVLEKQPRGPARVGFGNGATSAISVIARAP